MKLNDTKYQITAWVTSYNDQGPTEKKQTFFADDVTLQKCFDSNNVDIITVRKATVKVTLGEELTFAQIKNAVESFGGNS